MDVRNLSATGIQPLKQVSENSRTPEKETSFSELLKNAVDEVNSLQQQSSEMKAQLLTGQVQDLHQVMIASEKAGVAFQLTLQIRNKVVEAYQEIMRMQV